MGNEKARTLGDTIFELLQKSNENLIFVEDIENNHFKWSENSVDDLGLEDAEFQKDGLWEKIIHPDDYETFIQARKVMISGVSNQMRGEYAIRKKDGYYTQMVFHAFFFIQKNGEEKLFAGIFSDPYQYHAFNTYVGIQGEQEFYQALDTIENHQEQWMIMEIGIQDYEQIIDLYSTEAGPVISQYLKTSIEDCMDANMFCYQLEEQNFGILFQGKPIENVKQFFRKLQGYLMAPVWTGKTHVSFSIAAGVIRYPVDGEKREDLLRSMRITLRKAMEDRKQPLQFFSQEIIYQEQKKMQLLEKLQLSILEDFQGFYLCYQPLINAADGSIFGAEALLRWEIPGVEDLVYPDQFIPLLEESGLMLKVGKWVLRTAIKQSAEWNKIHPGFMMNINVSSQQFEELDFSIHVINLVKEYNANPEYITLELTESEALKDPKEMRGVFEFLRGQGFKIAFDDFGTGYGSLSIFRILSGDELKIDKEFLENITYDTSVQKIVGMVIDLCHKLNMIVCVEGVEREAEEQIVKELGGDIIQGYYYDRPLKKHVLEQKYLVEQEILINKGRSGSGRHSVLEDIGSQDTLHYLDSESILNNAYASIFQLRLDDNLTFVNCNEEMRKRLGYTSKDLEEKYENRGLSFLKQEDIPKVMNDIYVQLSKGDEILTEYRIVNSMNEEKWVLASGRAVRDKSGQPTLVVVSIDFDDFKKHTLDMERKYRLLKKLSDSLPGGIICIKNNPNFTVEFLSQGFLELSGYQREDIVNEYESKFLDIIYKLDRNKFIGELYKYSLKKEPFTVEFSIVSKEGQLIRVRLLGQMVPGDKDSTERLCGYVIEYREEFYLKGEKRERLTQNNKQYRDKTVELLERDVLTGLWAKDTALLLVLRKLEEKRKWILCVANIDYFREFNKMYGHPNGDKLLCAVAERLQRIFDHNQILGRVGIDEFLCFLGYDEEFSAGFRRVQLLSDELKKSYEIDGIEEQLEVSISIGAAFYPEDGEDYETLLNKAKKALYVTKELGGNSFSFASPMDN